MAHFAKITEDTKEVLEVLTLDDVNTTNSDGVEVESLGQQYLETHNNWPANLWIKTSYNTLNNTHRLGGTPFRGNYACIGFTWDETNEIFWPPKPFPSWVKNTATALWVSPIGDSPDLTEEQNNQNNAFTHQWVYTWDEANQQWNLIDYKA